MSLFDAIERAKLLTQTLVNDLPPSSVLEALQAELSTIESEAKRALFKTDAKSTTAVLSIDTKTGCYRSEGDAAFYCPRCYESDNVLSPTQRINSRLRVCPTCRGGTKSS